MQLFLKDKTKVTISYLAPEKGKLTAVSVGVPFSGATFLRQIASAIRPKCGHRAGSQTVLRSAELKIYCPLPAGE
jgi:hypothetical protein